MRLAVIGCGFIGAKRAAAAKGHDIVVVCDSNADRREALTRQTAARAVADWRDALSADIDAALIATTHDRLAEIALGAVHSGRHVLVEKPAGRSPQEARSIAEAAGKTDVIVKVGFNHRFHPAIARAKALADEGEIGSLLFIRGRYGHGGRLGYEKEWRFVRDISGGGELIDQGSHLIDLSRWFLGNLRLAYGIAPNYFWQGSVDDNCFVALEDGKGHIAWLHASWTEWKNLFAFEIMGKTGKLTIDGLGGSYGVERLTFHRMLPKMGPPETTIWEYPFPDRSFSDEFANFVAAIEGRARAIGDIDDAIANLQIVQSVYDRARDIVRSPLRITLGGGGTDLPSTIATTPDS
jgi:predicted dehydrogenase